MPIQWESLPAVTLQTNDKLMVIRGSGPAATPKMVTAGSAAARHVGEAEGQIPVLGPAGKIPESLLPDGLGGGVSDWGDLEGVPNSLSAIEGLTPAENRYVLYTGTAAASMATISANGQSLIAAANYAAMKALLDLEIGTDLERFSAFSTNANAAVTLVPTHDRARIRFTHATPVLTIATQTSQTYPDGFVCAGFGLAGLTVTAAAGVVLNGQDGGSVTVPPEAESGAFTLTRIGSNAWVILAPAAVSAFFRTLFDDADAAAVRATLGLGTAALLNAEGREVATTYNILSGSAYGMSETGIAADLLVSGAITLTPVAGAITHLYPLDPSTSTELPEVAEEQANRPLNALVSITSANSNANEFELIYPTPVDAAVLAGLENRVTQTRIVNDDPAATLTVKLAPYAAGRRTARWRGALTDVDLEPSDELLARAFWFAGDLDVDQFVRAASWATISVVSGSAGNSTSATGRPTPNALIGDTILQQVVRVGGQAIALPTGLGYAYPTVTPYGTDGRLIQPTPNRSTRVAWTTAQADGTHASGVFSLATARSLSAAYRNVAAVRQYGAAYGDASTSVAWPALPGPRAPNSWVVGIFNATGLAARVSPSGSTEDALYDAGPGSTVTSLSLWHYAVGEAYAPSPTTVTSCNWACTVLELTPRRLS